MTDKLKTMREDLNEQLLPDGLINLLIEYSTQKLPEGYHTYSDELTAFVAALKNLPRPYIIKITDQYGIDEQYVRENHEMFTTLKGLFGLRADPDLIAAILSEAWSVKK